MSDDRRKFEGDVAYEVWRGGGNPDSISETRLDDCYWERHDAEECGRGIIREQRQQREDRQMMDQRQEQEYFEQCQYQEEDRHQEEDRQYEEAFWEAWGWFCGLFRELPEAPPGEQQ